MDADKNPAPGPNLSPAVHAAIAHLAYERWEQEGCGHGSHERHWREAEHQLLGTPPAADLQPETKPVFEAPASQTNDREVPHFPPSSTISPV